MFSHSSAPTHKEYKSMTEEQFEEIVEAVLAGKYSWACVLILRAGGYNPLHYIPYRTYNRLIKNNCLRKGEKRQHNGANQSQELSQNKSSGIHQQHLSSTLNNLNYLEKANNNEGKISGGLRIRWYLPD